MRKIFLAVLIAAFGILAANHSMSAQTTPPLRGDFSASELSPFIEALWSGTGDGAGAARQMFDAMDSRAKLRGGLVKKNLKGQMVYWEHYALSSFISVHRADSTEVQDSYSEGAARHTGSSYKTRESEDATHYTERTDFMDEGFVSIWDAFQSFDSSHKKASKDKSMSGEAAVEVWYTPLKVHIKSAETTVPVYKDCTGAVDITLTDTQDRWVIDGYTLKVTSMNTGIFTLEAEEVTTGADGKARIRIHGVEKGKGRLRVYLYLAQPENNCYVEVEDYFDVEVLEPEKWTYDIAVHDEFTLPAHDYTMHGSFSVVASLGEDDLPHWQMLDVVPVTRSGGGTFPTMGSFLTETAREDGFALGFDVMAIIGRANSSLGAHVGAAAEGLIWGLTGQAETNSSKNVITTMLASLEEGSWSYHFDLKKLEQITGASAPGNDLQSLDAAAKEAMAQEQAEERSGEKSGSGKSGKKKEKKTSALKELRNAMKELKNFEMPDIDLSQPYSQTLSPQQEAAKATQIAYIKEHHVIVVPDFTQMLLPKWGNQLKEVERSGENVDVSWKHISGSLTLHKEN